MSFSAKGAKSVIDRQLFVLVHECEIAQGERDVYKRHLLNLLARIHRDGGQHTAAVGLEKSVEDADLRVAWLNSMEDAYK